ncbi:MAG: hypothetical protein IPP71_15625 [Bacteroidetes bacterium]|nr:hypothetical protein [Bacteroidota bacterium]
MRSLQPPVFTKIGWVNGNGTTNSNQEYAFDDRDVLPIPLITIACARLILMANQKILISLQLKSMARVSS